MAASDPRRTPLRRTLTRRAFIRASAGATAFVAGARWSPAFGAPASYPDWIAPSTKPPKKGGALARASAWDPPVIDPRLTQSVGLYQFAGLVYNRLVRYAYSDESGNPVDLTLKGDLAESWQGSADQRVWTFKIRKGVKWQNLPPMNRRELVAADI